MKLVQGTLLVSWVAVACAKPPPNVAIADMLTTARTNPIRAMSEYEDKLFRVTGVVESVGVHKHDHTVGHHRLYPFGGPLVIGKTDVETELRHYGVLVLKDPTRPELYVKCFFSPEKREQLAVVAPGTPATAECYLQEFKERGAEVYALLNTCTIAQMTAAGGRLATIDWPLQANRADLARAASAA